MDNTFHSLGFSFMDYVSNVCGGATYFKNYITEYKFESITIVFETSSSKEIIKRISFCDTNRFVVCEFFATILLEEYGSSGFYLSLVNVPKDLFDILTKRSNGDTLYLVNMNIYSTEDLLSFLHLVFKYYCRVELRGFNLGELLVDR